MLKIIIFIELILTSNLIFSQDKLVYNPLSKNPLFSKVDKVFDLALQFQSQHPYICKTASLVTLISPKKMTTHYKELFTDLGNLIVTFKFNENQENELGVVGGYAPIHNISTKELQEIVKQNYGRATNWLSQINNPKEASWSKFKSFFPTKSHPQGDTKAALSAIACSFLGVGSFFFKEINDNNDIKPNMNIASSVIKQDPYYEEQGFNIDYTFGSFEPNAFSLPFKNSGYKVDAGIGLAMALWDRGYSKEDILMGIRSVNLAYETLDLLWDHLGKKCLPGMFFCKNTKDSKLAPAYDKFLDRIRTEITNNPNLSKKLFGAAINISNYQYLPIKTDPLSLANPQKELELTFCLIALLNQNPKEFNKLYKSLSDHRAIYKLFENANRDLVAMNAGATFAIDKLNEDDLIKPKHPVKWEGIYKKIDQIKNTCQMPLDFFSNPISFLYNKINCQSINNQ